MNHDDILEIEVVPRLLMEPPCLSSIIIWFQEGKARTPLDVGLQELLIVSHVMSVQAEVLGIAKELLPLSHWFFFIFYAEVVINGQWEWLSILCTSVLWKTCRIKQSKVLLLLQNDFGFIRLWIYCFYD